MASTRPSPGLGKHEHKCPLCKKKRFCTDPSCEEIDYEWMCDECWGEEQRLEENPHGVQIKVEHCKEADQEHEESRRQYAHSFHRPGVICVAAAYFGLPETNRLGLLLHEVGHLLKGSGPHSEDAANEAVYRASGVRVYYRDGKAGPEVEWIRPQDKRKAREFLGL